MKTGKKRINKYNGPSDLCCKSGDFALLSAYIDGELSARQASEFSDHLKTCESCSRLYEISKLSLKITSNYKGVNKEALAAIPSSQIEQSKSVLLKALRMEPGYGIVSEPTIADQKWDKSKSRFLTRLGTMKFSSYAGMAAIFVVVVITLIVYSSSGILRNLNGNRVDNKQTAIGSFTDNVYESSSYAGGAKDSEIRGISDAEANNDMGSPATSSAYEELASNPPASSASYSASASSSASFDMTAADRIYFAGQDYFWLDGENETKYIAVTNESLFSSEYSDTLYAYVGIFAYPKDTAGSYLETFKIILGASAFHANIEITGGENSQKLVEYTGEDEALYMLSKAELNNAALLIISIGR